MVIEVATIRTWTWNRATASFDTLHQRLVAPRISCSGTTDLEAHGVKRESPIWYSWSDGDASGAYELIPDSGKMSTTRARGLLPCLRRVHLHNGQRRILPNNFVLCFFFFFLIFSKHVKGFYHGNFRYVKQRISPSGSGGAGSDRQHDGVPS